MPHLHTAFQIDAAPGADTYVVQVRGELDLARCPALELALAKAEASEADRILLDLEQLTFADASALNVLRVAGHRSTVNGDRLRISRGGGQVARMFRLTALDRKLPFADATPGGGA